MLDPITVLFGYIKIYLDILTLIQDSVYECIST